MSSPSQQLHSRHQQATGKLAPPQSGNCTAGAIDPAPASVASGRGGASANTTGFKTMTFRTELPSRPPASAASTMTPADQQQNQQHQNSKHARQQSNSKARHGAPPMQLLPAASRQPESVQSIAASSAPSLRRRSVPLSAPTAYIYVGANQHYPASSEIQPAPAGMMGSTPKNNGLQQITSNANADLMAVNARTSAQLQQLEFFRPHVDYRRPAAAVATSSTPPLAAAGAAARQGGYAVPTTTLLPPQQQHTHHTRSSSRRTSNESSTPVPAPIASVTAPTRQVTFVSESGQQKLLAAGIRPDMLARASTPRVLSHGGLDEVAQRSGTPTASGTVGNSVMSKETNGESCPIAPAAAATAGPRAASSPPADRQEHNSAAPYVSQAQTPLQSPPLRSKIPAALLIPPTPAATPNTSTPVSPATATSITTASNTTTTTSAAVSAAAGAPSRTKATGKTHSPSSPWAPTLPPAILQSRNPISRDEFMKVLDAHVAAEKAAAAASAAASALSTTTTTAADGGGKTVDIASALPPQQQQRCSKPAPPVLTIEQPSPAALAVLGKRRWEDFAAAQEAFLAGQRAAATATSATAAAVDKESKREHKGGQKMQSAEEEQEYTDSQPRVPLLMDGIPRSREGDGTEEFAERLRLWTESVARRIVHDASTLLHAHSTTLQTQLLASHREHGHAAATLASIRAVLAAERAEHGQLLEENSRAPMLAARAEQLEAALVDAVVARVGHGMKSLTAATTTTTITPMDVDEKQRDKEQDEKEAATQLAALQRQVAEVEARCSVLADVRQRVGGVTAAAAGPADGGLGPAAKLLARLLSGGGGGGVGGSSSAAAADAAFARATTAGDAVFSLLASEHGVEEVMEALDLL
ncbi:hypothetical protein HDU86_000816 [Geranomyces michiganensis]|nr:hypothetical protein HDU86_000816 [Geranomyces michiganensis]